MMLDLLIIDKCFVFLPFLLIHNYIQYNFLKKNCLTHVLNVRGGDNMDVKNTVRCVSSSLIIENVSLIDSVATMCIKFYNVHGLFIK